jgi:hypothetical protein
MGGEEEDEDEDEAGAIVALVVAQGAAKAAALSLSPLDTAPVVAVDTVEASLSPLDTTPVVAVDAVEAVGAAGDDDDDDTENSAARGDAAAKGDVSVAAKMARRLAFSSLSSCWSLHAYACMRGSRQGGGTSKARRDKSQVFEQL